MIQTQGKAKIIIFIFTIGFLAIFALICFSINNLIFKPLNLSEEEIIFEINPGDKGISIAQKLEEKGLIKSAYVFFIYNVCTNGYRDMKAGKYLLDSSLSIFDIAEIIKRGDVLPEIVVTIPEGFSLSQTQDRLEEFFPEINLYSYRINQFQDEFDFLFEVPSDATLEGYLYPDTYHFNHEMASEEIIVRMLENFKYRLSDLIEEAKEREINLHDLIIVASLLEKEAREYDDRRLIADVINKRLIAGMPLQIDATITYLTGQKTTVIGRDELNLNSPYNTYLYPGLPYGPICHPGRQSVKAVLSPEKNDYFYYLSTSEGDIIFSRNLIEHNQAKNKYLR